MPVDPYAQPYVPPASLVVDSSDIEDLGDIKVSDEEDRAIREATRRAESDLAARTVTMRLTGEQLALLERAAATCGIGLAAYVKDAALHRAGAERPGASNERGVTQ